MNNAIDSHPHTEDSTQTCAERGQPIRPARWKKGLASLATVAALACAWLPSPARASQVQHNIIAGNLQVDQIPGYDYNAPEGYNDNTNAIVTCTLSINGFGAASGPPFNRADYTVYAYPSEFGTNDYTRGLFIGAVMQNGRTNTLPNYQTNCWQICQTEANADKTFRFATCQTVGSAGAGTTIECNVNVAGAFFPYSSWLAGWARSLPYTNGYPNNYLVGSPGMKNWTDGAAYTNFTDLKGVTGASGGKYIVDLTSYGVDSRTNGILLVTGGKDENNYVMSAVNAANGTWNVFLHDIGADGASYEADELIYVYIPLTNTTVVSGKFQSDKNGSPYIAMYSGAQLGVTNYIKATAGGASVCPQFTITNIANGRWALWLKTPNYTPTNGVLITSPSGGGNINADNIVTYQALADGSGWEINSRDLPNGGLQSPYNSTNGPEEVCSFVFVPANMPGVTVTPTNNLHTSSSGGTGTFTVVLDRAPYSDVTIPVSSSDLSEGTVDKPSLTFTPANYAVPQAVTVTGQPDGLPVPSVAYQINLGPAASADPRYSGMAVSGVAALNYNGSVPGVVLSKSSVTTSQSGQTDTFAVSLNTQPTADVVIGLLSSDLGQATVSPASVTFTIDNWATPQTITVTGVNNSVAAGNVGYTVVTAPAVSADPSYNGLNGPDVSGINLGVNVAGFALSPPGVVVNESGTTATFTVALTSKPVQNVAVTLASSNPAKGTGSPTLMTFTPGNWSKPQTATVRGVDNLIMDGPIQYSINLSVVSDDPVYAPLTAQESATTVDNEAALVLPSGAALYGVGDPGVGLDGAATLADPYTVNYNGVTLTATITANGSADDRLTIRNDGAGAGQIGVSGNSVSYSGTAIGNFAGGIGTTQLVVTFNAAGLPEAAQALLRCLTYGSVSTSPTASVRTVTVTLAHTDGGTSSASKTVQISVVHVYDYQAGADYGYGPYQGAVDVEISPSLPDTTFPIGTSSAGMWLDYVSSENNQVLLGFTNIFGTGPGQIPPGATIVSAQLTLYVNDNGNGGRFYRMLIPWNPQAETWTSMGGGVQTDDVEATSTTTAFWGLPYDIGLVTCGVGPSVIGVTTDLRTWASGQANYGWVITTWDFGSNGTGFSPCEDATVPKRPRLHVVWVPAGTQMASFQQGVNDYTNAYDTSIRQNAPDADRSAVAALFSDWAVSGTSDNEQVLMRFDDIIGSAAGQIPSGATVSAAVLDLTGDVGNAPGHGGQFYALLQPWQDTNSTWNFWGGGIQPDGVKAATTPTAAVGNASLFPLVQATVNAVDLTADVKAWVSGTRTNYGWVVLPWTGGSDGWGFSSAEATNPGSRPQLRVYYTAAATPPRISSVIPGTSSVAIGFSGPVGAACSVWRAATVSGSYTNIGPATVQSDGTASFTDHSPLASGAFYRISNP